MTHVVVHPIWCLFDEVVDIHWRDARTKQVFVERRSCPPQAVRDAVEAREKQPLALERREGTTRLTTKDVPP